MRLNKQRTQVEIEIPKRKQTPTQNFFQNFPQKLKKKKKTPRGAQPV